jgi:beta-glucosidase
MRLSTRVTGPVLAAAIVVLSTLSPTSASAAGRCGAHPWCDTSLSPDARAALVVAALTPSEKLDLLWGDEQFGVLNPPGGKVHTGSNDGVARLDIPPFFMSDGPVGPRQGAGATSMPAPLGLAASFDPALAARAGALVADEVKAKGNDLVFAPTVNIMRTPLGGRTFEGYGEDPFLSGRQAVGWITGAQGRGVIANVKHFAANNQETERMTGNSIVDERTLREIYLPQFEAAVKEAGSGSVMCSYNKLNGQHACENHHLLTDILKNEWGYKGFVLADYPAAHDTAESLANGLDFEPFGTAYNPAATALAVAQGKATQAQVDEHVSRILRTMFAFGVFDRAAYANDDSKIPVAEHAKVAQEVEEGGITLLKNAGGVLPLNAAKGKTLALIGSDAAAFKNGGGSSNVTPLATITPQQGIEARAKAAGVAVRYEASDDPAQAAAAAKDADVAVVVVANTATEGADQPCLRIDCTDDTAVNGFGTSRGKERNLDAVIEAVAKANPRTVVVMETSGPVLTPWRDAVAGILEAWYPGESGGAAIARVLFGDVDPGGRLPATFPLREEDLPTAGDPEKYPGVNGQVTYKEGVFVGYRWYDERKLGTAFPFGFGLSYTSFSLSGLRTTSKHGTVTVTATVRNTGKRTGYAVPQLYVGLPDPDAGAGVTQPPVQLKAFRKLLLKRGAAGRVRFTLDRRALSYYSVAKNGWTIAPGCYRIKVGTSSRALPLRTQLARAGGHCGRARVTRR